jgi:hypothetical protein
MARIRDQFIKEVDQSGDTYIFTVTYTATFAQSEIGQMFEDAVRLFEDDPSDDDVITAYPVPEAFLAQGASVSRRHQVTATTDMVNTELGNEEIKARVWLRQVGMAPAADEQYTPIWTLDP